MVRPHFDGPGRERCSTEEFSTKSMQAKEQDCENEKQLSESKDFQIVCGGGCELLGVPS